MLVVLEMAADFVGFSLRSLLVFWSLAVFGVWYNGSSWSLLVSSWSLEVLGVWLFLVCVSFWSVLVFGVW